MANTYTQILNYGTQAAYDALQTKNPDLLYFCSDTGKLYKGSVDYTNNLVVAATKPEAPIAGKIYFLSDTNTVEVYVNGNWKVVSYPIATTVDIDSDDMHVASAKAVYDAIMAAVEDVTSASNTVSAVEAGTEAGTFKVTKGDGTSETVSLTGVVTTPTWDATSRKLTIPVVGGDTLEVNIGKDIYIDSTAANGYNAETGNIDLYLNDGSDNAEPTLISIPASALIDVYTGTTSNGTNVTVGDDNVIKVDLVIDPVEGNALVLTESGLKVDLSAYAKSSEVQSVQTTLQNQIQLVNETVTENKANIATMQTDITDLKSADISLSDRVTVVEGKAKTNEENISALSTAATSWGTF